MYRHHHRHITIVAYRNRPSSHRWAGVPLCKTECTYHQFDDIIVVYLPLCYYVGGESGPISLPAGWLGAHRVTSMPDVIRARLVPYEASGYVADGTTRLRGIDGGV